MKTDNRAFRELMPPPGGVERFRRRLEGQDEPPHAVSRAASHAPLGRIVVAGLAASVLAIAVIVAPPRPGGDTEQTAADIYEAREFDRLLGRSTAQAELSVAINDEPVSVAEIPSANARVRIYEITGD